MYTRKNILMYYEILTRIKSTSGTFRDSASINEKSYLSVTSAEEISEVMLAISEGDYIKAFLETTDLLGLLYLSKWSFGLTIKKPTPILCTLDELRYQMERAIFMLCKRVRGKEGNYWTDHRMLIQLRKIICMSINKFVSSEFNVDFYDLVYMGYAISGIKILTREELHLPQGMSIYHDRGVDKDSFIHFFEDIIRKNQFLQKNSGGLIGSVRTFYQEGIKTW